MDWHGERLLVFPFDPGIKRVVDVADFVTAAREEKQLAVALSRPAETKDRIKGFLRQLWEKYQGKSVALSLSGKVQISGGEVIFSDFDPDYESLRGEVTEMVSAFGKITNISGLRAFIFANFNFVAQVTGDPPARQFQTLTSTYVLKDSPLEDPLHSGDWVYARPGILMADPFTSGPVIKITVTADYYL